MNIMKKKLGILIQGFLLMFLIVPAAYSAPTIDGVMSYTDSTDWGGLSVKTTATFTNGTSLANVVVEEGDAAGEANYDVEELGVYIEDNMLYIGLQTEYNLSSDPDTKGIYAGDFIFTFGDSGADTFSDYNNFGTPAFAFDFTVKDGGDVDVTFLSGTLTGTGVGTDINNYGTDWGIHSATTEVVLSDGYEAAYSGRNDYSHEDGYSFDSNEIDQLNYANGKHTLELAIDLDSLSEELGSLLSTSDASVAMYWQPSCGNDFLAASADFDYRPNTAGGLSPVPEPATLLLFGMGLLGAGALGRRRGQLKKSN